MQRISVFGAGTMGANIALEFAMHGFETTVYSRKQQTLETAQRVVATAYKLLIEEGMLTPEGRDGALARLHYTTSVEEAAKNCDIVMETIVEKPEAKRALYEELDTLLGPDITILSDTSALNVYDLMPERRRPKALIAHYFAPAHLIPVVELVKGKNTDPAVVDATKKMYDDMGKIPVVINSYKSGFFVNRLQRAVEKEVNAMLDEGYMSAEDMDLAAKGSMMFRGVVLGVVQRMDFTGLDLMTIRRLDGRETMNALADAGHYGVKTGKGYYDYSHLTLEEALDERDRRLIRTWKVTEPYIKNLI